MSDALDILGVPIDDCRMEDALARVEGWMRDPAPRTRLVYFVNANTLNVACDDPPYRDVLRSADVVYGDGTGVRLAARLLHGVRLRDNVNGTDFVPRMLESRSGRGYRYFLLGATEEMSARAAEHARRAYPGWELVGRHHGYLDAAASEKVVDEINAARPHLLFVAMGHPAQERWIEAHRDRLRIPVCVAIGGFLAYWSGDIVRAPGWLRAIGFEWVHLLLSQPHKMRRYLLGNPLFLWRVLAYRFARTAASR